MHGLWSDIRYGVRALLRTPGVTALVILTLGLGIGANVAVFSAIDGVLLEPLSFPAPERLVLVWEESRAQGITKAPTSAANFLDWRSQARSFEGMAVFRGDELTLTGAGEPAELRGARVSSALFALLGVRPAAGQFFGANEDRPGGEPVAVLSRGLWQRRFGADPGVVGRSLKLGGVSRRVVGVAPDLEFLRWADVFLPVALGAEDVADRGARRLGVLARLRPGVTLARAASEMELIASRLEQAHPEANAGWRVQLTALREAVVGDVRHALLLLQGAVGFVLLIACTNVGSLLLVRALARQQEVAVRLALGAGAARIGRQLITESLLLGLLSGLFGLLLASAGIRLLAAALAADLPRAERIGLDGRVLAFALVLSVLTSLLFGLAPVLQVRRPDLIAALKQRGDDASGGRTHLRRLGALIVLEFALTMALLVGAGLLARSFQHLLAVDVGFKPQQVLMAELSLPAARYQSPERQRGFAQRMLERVGALPGVGAAAIGSSLPVTGFNRVLSFTVEGVAAAPAQEPSASWTAVSPGYFQVLGIPLRRGRVVLEKDRQGSLAVAVINETMARRYWPGADPLGHRLTLSTESAPREVIGVVGDVKIAGLTSDPMPAVYVPYAQSPFPSVVLFVRGAQPASLTASVRSGILAVDPDQPVTAVGPLTEVLERSLAKPRSNLLLLGSFALFGLALAAIGLYGLMAYSIGRRTRELAVRIAMGAEARQVLRLVMGHALALALAGVALGSFLALAMGPLAASLLYRVSPADPFVLSTVALLLLAVALAASLGPAVRALRIDPVAALR
jgi:putative ABC transport system permease protein